MPPQNSQKLSVKQTIDLCPILLYNCSPMHVPSPGKKVFSMFHSIRNHHSNPVHCHCNNCRRDFEADALSSRCPECGSRDVRDVTRAEWKEHLKKMELVNEEKSLYWTWAVR